MMWFNVVTEMFGVILKFRLTIIWRKEFMRSKYLYHFHTVQMNWNFLWKGIESRD